MTATTSTTKSTSSKPAAKSPAKKATYRGLPTVSAILDPIFAKPAAASTSNPAAKPASKAAAKPAAKPAAKSTSKAAAKPAVKSTSKAAAKPAAKSTSKAAAKPAVKSTSKAAAKPAVKVDTLSEHIAEVFAKLPKGTFRSVSAITAEITKAYPSADARPAIQTVYCRCRDERLPEGVTAQVSPRGAVKG